MFTRRVSHFRYHSPPADNDEYCLRPTITIDSKYYFLLSEPQTQMFTNDDEEEWSSASYAPSDGDDDDDEEGSSSSYDDDDVSNDHSSCSSLDDDDNITGPLILPSFTNFVLRRRRNGGADYNDDGINGDDEEDPQTTPQRKQQRPQAFRVFRKQQRSLRRKYHLIGCTPSRCSSCLLVFAMVVWLNVYVFYSDPRPSQGWWLDNSYLASSQDKAYAEMVQRRIGKPPKHFVKKVQGKGFFDNMLFHKPKSVEDLPDGCHYQKWQLAQYPNCNDLHEMDLKTLLKLQKQPKPKSNEISSSGRYIDSGLWRDVWSLAPRELPTQQQQELVVLKMMKPGMCTIMILYEMLYVHQSLSNKHLLTTYIILRARCKYAKC